MGYAHGYGYGHTWKSNKAAVSAPSAPAAAPVNTVLPVISGTPTVGETISTTTGTWTGSPTPTYTYQWKRAGASISGATASTYTLVALDTAALITVTVTATNASGSASATSASFGTINLTPSNAVAPVASGSLTVGSVLTSTTGTWAGTPVPTYAYQWKRDSTNVGTNASTYTLVTADIGAMMTCVVTGTNTAGSANATSNSLGPIVAAAVGGAALLITPTVEADGWATDFTYATDASRVALKTGGTVVSSGLSFFTKTSGSVKWVYDVTGTLVSVGTTSLAVDYDPVTHAALGLLREPAATNLCLQSSDLTNASWTKSNLTTAKTATGPDGVANSATTITASSANATALQAITSVSASRVTSVFLKRRTGTGNVDLTQNNGSTWTTQTLTSSWTRILMVPVSSANPTIGIRLVTSGDAVDVALFQHELTYGLRATPTSPIPTTTASVTRAADRYSITPASINFSSTAGSWWADIDVIIFLDNYGRVVGMQSFYTPISIESETTLGMFAGGSPLTLTIGDINDMETPRKIASAAQNADMAVTSAGLTPATGTHGAAGTGVLNPGSIISFGCDVDGGLELLCYIRKIRYVPRRKSNAELVAETVGGDALLFDILLETGDSILMEDGGGTLLLEA
jgi:hypothetical protein